MPPILIKLLFLGPAKNLVHTETASLEVAAGSTIADLRTKLIEQYPGLRAGMATIRWAVNEELAPDDRVLCAGDEVALIPPVSGGADEDDLLIDLVTGPIDAARVRRFVTGDRSVGGIVTFEGTTRGETDPDHGRLARLDYEAYEPMARRQLERLAGEARQRWSAGRVALVHRLGPVPPGEVSVMIAVACGHRAESFEACRWLIDALKRDVPIWKKDVFEDGFVRWVKPSPPA